MPSDLRSALIEAASAYIPMEWRHALARGETLPDRTSGAVLFADISGFTALTEALTEALGLRRGAEELPHHLDRVYDALIAEVHRYGGSVVSFAGDAITCWFDAATSPPLPVQAPQADGRTSSAARAVSCAWAMQDAIGRLDAVPVPGRPSAPLAMRIGVASGPVRRIVVGDPAIQLKPILAGATIARVAAAERLAAQGGVVIDAETAAILGELAPERQPLVEPEAQAAFASVGRPHGAASPAPWPDRPPNALTEDQVRPWVLPAVYERLAGGLGSFLTELRPAVALFLRFDGIDFDGDDDAGAMLDAHIRGVQRILAAQAGFLVQLTAGDKGSYLYAAFGAPIAHENDVHRAISTALALRDARAGLDAATGARIGVAAGAMRTGAYGGASCRTYGVLGDDVNLAARLMGLAAPDEILVSGRVQHQVAGAFLFEPRPPIRLKGKAEPLPIFALIGPQRRRPVRLQEPAYALPMVGRAAELESIAGRIDLVLQGHGQVVGVTGEAGIGKSRLIAEAIRLARRRGLAGYGGACQSDGTNVSLLVWSQIWQALFDVDPEAPPRRQATPLLGALLGVPIPDNDFTHELEPRDRKTALEALLLDCLGAAAREAEQEGGGLLLVLEDLHWIDPASTDLLERVARAAADLPVLILLAYRPPEETHARPPSVESLPHFTPLHLAELSPAEAEAAIRAKLAQLFPEQVGGVSVRLIARLTERAQGNPFYLEELLNYLRDRGIDAQDTAAFEALDLPSSLHSLILSRIDQLTARQQLTVKVASVIGRVFRFAHLHGYYPAFGQPEPLRADLDHLASLDVTPLDTPEPELAYLFKHIVTREVAYENLPYATRAGLHEAYARYLETEVAPTRGLAPFLDALAYHYDLSENLAKKRAYLQQAGEAAAARYANAEAVSYFERLLPLLAEPAEQVDALLKLGSVLELVGRWPEAEARYREALDLARQEATSEPHMREVAARCLLALGHLAVMRTDYPAAQDWLEQARAAWQVLGDRAGLARTLAEMGFLIWRQGEPLVAQSHLEEGLALARALDDRPTMAFALNYLANTLLNQGEFKKALPLRQECLALRRASTDKQGLCIALDNLGLTLQPMGGLAAARALFEESFRIRTEVGDRWGIQRSLNSLGELAFDEGDLTTAKMYWEESLALARELDERHEIKLQYDNLGTLARLEGDYAAARQRHEDSLALNRELGDRGGVAVALYNLGADHLVQDDLEPAQALFAESLALMREVGEGSSYPFDFLGLAVVAGKQALTVTAVEASARACRAARLAGAAEALTGAMGIVMDREMRPLYESAVAGARAVLDESDYAAAHAEGQAMTLDEAIAYALET